MNTQTSIILLDGSYYDFNNLPGKYNISIIAHSLSHLCRYHGHCYDFYSVAEHSVYVSLLVPRMYALEGLLHDASEAFCNDIASPLKKILPDYKAVENRVQEDISDYFNLMYPFPKEVKDADMAIYKTERSAITPGNDHLWYPGVAPAKMNIKCLPPKEARELFINRYEEITGDKVERYGSSPRKAA